jgi:7-cyano-7-deazaguanine synthase
LNGALVLLSGGMDSAVCLYEAVRSHGAVATRALFFDWHQRTVTEERNAAELLCQASGSIAPVIVTLDFPYGGALTDTAASVPLDRSPATMSSESVAPTFFPGRNLVMLAYAYGLAAADGLAEIYFGPNADDAAGYPDCREEFLSRFDKACRSGTGHDARLVLPLVRLSKADIVREGDRLGVPWELTFSCYAPVDRLPCGRCDACVLRDAAFAAARPKS